MNPILDRAHFVPDGEAREMPDGRLYLYGSYDIGGDLAYCSDCLHVFSTDDLESWNDHGVAFRVSDIPWAKEGSLLYAPDCIYHNGTYYLYFCLNGGKEGVAISDTPKGPFHDPVELQGVMGIDPAVFVDNDGQAYYFWGQFHLHGAKLNDDMKSIDWNSHKDGILDEKNHGFHEGACIRKFDGKYYLFYTDTSRGRATCISYAVAQNPLGPYKKGGVVIDNIFCDPETWNNHGSVAEYKGKRYVFYHRSSQNSRFSRRMCVEPVEFLDGAIKEVEMTTQGSSTYLNAPGVMEAARACQVRNGVYITLGQGGEVLSHAVDGSWAAYKYVSFQKPSRVVLSIASAAQNGVVEIWAGEEKLGECTVEKTGSWERYQDFSCELEPFEGIAPLYLVFRSQFPGTRLMDVREIRFLE